LIVQLQGPSLLASFTLCCFAHSAKIKNNT
jgi:hypothetical protein